MNILLPYNLANILIIYPEELKIYAHTEPTHGCLKQLYYNCQVLGKNQDILQEMNVKINCDTSRQGILLVVEKKWTIEIWRNLKHILPSEGANLRKLGSILFQLHMTFWKRQNYGDSEMISGCQGMRERGE